MDVSNQGLDLIKESEGLRLEAYLDGGGVPTIGYGTTHIDGEPVKLGMKITEEQATEYLRADVQDAVQHINDLVKVKLSQPQFDALVDFVYNLGDEAFAESTLLKHLNTGRFGDIQYQFLRWNHDNGKVVKGLTKRRLREAVLFGPFDRKTLIQTYKLDV